MKANEQQFDKQLTEISDIYEKGKMAIQTAEFGIRSERANGFVEADACLKKLRDIACVNLRKNHDVNEN